MRVSEGLSVAEAARRLGWSEPTIRRHIDSDLERVPGSRPIRITIESIDRQRQRELGKLGLHEDSHPQDTATRQSEVEALRVENEKLRAVITSLRLALRAVDDALGHLTLPATPND